MLDICNCCIYVQKLCCARLYYFYMFLFSLLVGSESVNNLIVGVNFNGVFYCSLQKNVIKIHFNLLCTIKFSD